MPRVPVLPTVQLNPQGPAQYSAPGVVPVQDQSPRQAMAMGEAFQKAGAQLGDYEAAIQKRQDIAEADEVWNKVSEDDINALSSFRKLVGKPAVDGFDAFDKDQQARYRKAIEGAKNDRQRQWLKEKLSDRRLQVIDTAMTHRDRQLAVQRIGVAAASSKQSVRDAIEFIGTPKGEEAMQSVVQRAREQADLTGDNPDELARVQMQEVHLGYVDKLLNEGRTGEAMQWLDANKADIDPDEFAKAKKQTRAQEIGDVARMLDQSVDSMAGRLAAFDAAEAKGLPREEADLGRRHLFMLENQRDARNAEIAQDVELEARRWMQSTGLPVEANPELADKVTTYGVTLKRVTNQKALDAFYAAPPAELDRLRSLTPPQLHRELAPLFDEHDEGMVTKFLRGDQSGARIDDLTKILARQLAILPGNDSNADATPQQNRLFEVWKANTIAPILKAETDRLKRPLTPDEFQKLIVNPILADKVWSDVGRNEELPLMQLQQMGEAPVDDPLTEKNEALDFDAYSGLYVNVSGQQVLLRDIPLDARKAIRDKWGKKNPGVWLSAAEEAATWLEMKAEADKANPPKQPKRVEFKINDLGGINVFDPMPSTQPK